jgi:transposase
MCAQIVGLPALRGHLLRQGAARMRCVVKKRRFSSEFKREAVMLVRNSGKSVTQVARELGIGTGLLAKWKREIEAQEATGMKPDELEELKMLRKENARLKMEVEILGEATAFFANRRK